MAAPVALTGAGNVTSGTQQSATSVSADKPANTADGDLLVAAWFHRNARADTSSITVPSGWSVLGTVNVTDETFGMWCKPIPVAASEAPTSYTWTVTSGGSGRCMLSIFRVTGVNLNGPQDSFGAQAVHTGTTSITDPAVTAVSDEALLLACNVANTSSGNGNQPLFTPPGGMTEVTAAQITNTSPASSSMQVAQQTLSAAGSTGTRTFTMAPTASNSGGFMAALAPIKTASATLTASSALAGTAAVVAKAAAALNAAAVLAADGQTPPSAGATLTAASAMSATPRQTHVAAASLAASSALTATPIWGQLNVLVGGLWQPIVLRQLVAGSWVEE